MRLFFAKILIGLLSLLGYQQLGSFTTLNSTDTVKNFPTTYNANLTKTIEIGTTTVASITTLANLSTVGTITSGTWNGSTLTVGFGGTGSTTLSANQILLGNGTGNISLVNGYGTANQFLTSNGAGLAPSWQTSAVDQSIAYNWTGSHTFTRATSTAFAVSGSVLGLNGVQYRFPNSDGASSSILMTDGNTNLNWNTNTWIPIAATTTPTATSSLTFANLPNYAFYKVTMFSLGFSSSDILGIRFNDDNGANYSYKTTQDFTIQTNINGDIAARAIDATTSPMYWNMEITNRSASAKYGTMLGTAGQTSGTPTAIGTFFIWNNTSSVINKIRFYAVNSSSNNFAQNTAVQIYGRN